MKLFQKIQTLTLLKFNKKQISLKRSFYERLFSRYADGQFYYNFLQNKNKIETSIAIKHTNNIKLNELSLSDIIRLYGSPNYEANSDKIIPLKILFYKHSFVKHKTLLEFHFLNNNLFFYRKTFLKIGKEIRKEIIHTIKEKYVSKEIFDNKNNYIVDDDDTILLTHDNAMYFSLFYMNNHKVFLEKISDNINFTKLKKTENKKKYITRLSNSL